MDMRRPIYLDNNATTPLDPRALEAMLPYLMDEFGNASSSSHAFGWAADAAVQKAREQTAGLVNGTPEEIIFTSGATEAVNMAIKGVARAYAGKGRHIVSVATEHKAVLDTLSALRRDGFEITLLDVQTDGRLSSAALAHALRGDTILVSIMWANNETGVVHDIPALSNLVRSRGILFFTDATQAVGKIPISIDHVDLMAFSGHKMYGPKGVGGLFVRRRGPRVRLRPILDGGGQERGRRGGTLNTPGIVGLGAAAELAQKEMSHEATRLGKLRDLLEKQITSRCAGTFVNGSSVHRLPHTSNITFPGHRSASLMSEMRDLAVSAGSACSSDSGESSHVLRAHGLTDEDAFSTIRFGLGRFTTREEIDIASHSVVKAFQELSSTAKTTET
jgi:cysteine desulfurase